MSKMQYYQCCLLKEDILVVKFMILLFYFKNVSTFNYNLCPIFVNQNVGSCSPHSLSFVRQMAPPDELNVY